MSGDGLTIRALGKEDYDYVVSVLDRWWGGPSSQRADPFFFYEFGDAALAAVAEDKVVGFLLGFRTADLGFIHLVGIDPDFRRRGVGHELYEHFANACRAAGIARLKAIAAVGNEGSVAFHEAEGFSVEEIADYAGPGRARVVFTKTL